MFGQPGKARKGGSPSARAARARLGHQRRHARNLSGGQAATHYKGHGKKRTRKGWFTS